MEKNLFEVGADIDVEALMSRLRESAKQRGTAVANALSPKEPEQRTLKTLQSQRLTQEIHSGALSVDVIDWIPLKARGTKGRVEFRVKKFLKWLVHWNTKGQADFNHSVMTSLGLIAEDLQTGQGNFATVEGQLRDIAAQSSELERKMNRELEEIRQNMQSELGAAVAVLREDLGRNALGTRLLTEQVSGFSANLAALEQKVGPMIEESARRLQGDFGAADATLREEMNRLLTEQVSGFSANVAALEQKVGPMIEESARRLQADFGAAEATLREEMNRLLTDQVSGFSAAAANSAALEQKVGRMIEESAQHLQADFRMVEATLREEMNRNVQQLLEETRSKTETLAAQSSELKGKLDHELVEFRMRTLRVERIARNARRDIGAAEEVKREDLSDAQPGIRNQRRRNGKEKVGTPTRTSSGSPFSQAFDYFLFEHRHRGPVSEIKRRQSTYLDLFLEKKNVVDLGCGRGEFVELLTENGINVTGVDSSEDMVDFCRDRGLTVVQADIFEYLAGLPDGKLDGIFLSQVVEHVSPEQILKLLGLCAEKLEPGAVIVIETMNTNCPAALSNFFLDPTHVRPVPAEMLRFMAEQASFQVKYLRFTSPLPGNGSSEILDFASGLTSEVMVYQDYAVVAIKR